MTVRVFDATGAEQSWEWAVSRYGIGLLEAEPPEGATVYRVTELRQKIGPCGQVVHVINENGNPLDGVAVIQGWADDPQALEPEAAPRTAEDVWEQPYGKPNRGSGGFTNLNGDFGWGWGAGQQYIPSTTEGPHWYWVLPGGDQVYSDVPSGFGWLWGSDHDTLNITFTRTLGDEEPEPPEPEPPEDGDLAEVLERLDLIEIKLDTIEGKLDRIGGHFT